MPMLNDSRSWGFPRNRGSRGTGEAEARRGEKREGRGRLSSGFPVSPGCTGEGDGGGGVPQRRRTKEGERVVESEEGKQGNLQGKQRNRGSRGTGEAEARRGEKREGRGRLSSGFPVSPGCTGEGEGGGGIPQRRRTKEGERVVESEEGKAGELIEEGGRGG
ncbi:spore wall protein 2-like [Spinacia oleracea]|uniref:Spore wall protein 2-like n=1 Tax=Spinacia oleracea TaxID=3562 RepID=A0ABM3QY13_SPIOL|nr:spore wall protein 2-like [Spinacia oleracea]